MGKNRLSIVLITHQFEFFTLRFLSRKNVEKKFVLTNKNVFVTSIQFVAFALRENLSNRSSGVQIPRDICTPFGRYLYSTKCSWIIKTNIGKQSLSLSLVAIDIWKDLPSSLKDVSVFAFPKQIKYYLLSKQ